MKWFGTCEQHRRTNGIVASEAIASKGNLNARDEVISREGLGEVLEDGLHAACEVGGHAVRACSLGHGSIAGGAEVVASAHHTAAWAASALEVNLQASISCTHARLIDFLQGFNVTS